MDEEIVSHICQVIVEELGDFQLKAVKSLSGGCINDAYCFQGVKSSYFVKCNQRSFLKNFQAEALALKEIGDTGSIKVPEVIAAGSVGASSFLILEFLEFNNSGSAEGQRNLGAQLASLHRKTASYFGWDYDNVIGATPQRNPLEKSWVEFFARHRLEFQFKLAKDRGGRSFAHSERVLSNMDCFFQNYMPVPSLLHGDLWGGNVAFICKDQPVLFDPATYYGDRECDIAFTEVFGGFTQDFYRSYNSEWPLSDGYEVRKHLYNLYHWLNHYNLFGSSYAGQVESTISLLVRSL